MTVVFLDRKVIIGGTLVVALAFVVGVLIGYFGKSPGNPEGSAMYQASIQDKFHSEQELMKTVIDDVDADSIRTYLKELTKEPHIAALRRDKELTNWIKKEWEDAGLDFVELNEYDFYLSWPNQTNPNKIYLVDSNGEIRFTSKHKEQELRDGDDHPEFVHAFNGYAPAGEVEVNLEDVIYTNYARVEDLRELEDMGISVEGKICLARYGKIFRGNKVKNCQVKGAIGVIMYTDPAEVAVEGTEPENVYPNTFFLPGSGVQRGSTFIGDGDPLSPGWPSIENSYRLGAEEVDGLPKIPAQPIGYDDARIILEKMGGRHPPEAWKGKLDHVEYRLGGEVKPGFEGWKLQLKTHNWFDTVKSSNVIGYIKGEVEPDRYVFLSNHRDAWGYGAVDPSSGTAQLMEVARSLGKIHKDGWKPRRTIVFCSWAAEEYGLEGSYEFVSEKLSKIMARSVGLVNTDICVSGPIVKPQASPVLKDVVKAALQHASVPTPESPRSQRSYYDFWYEWYNQDNDGEKKEPAIKLLGSGTDHAAFVFYAGVPAVNLRFKDDTKKHKGVGQYPTYHTGFETFYLVDKIIDPGFRIHRTCAQTSIHILLNLADSLVLPYNFRNFGEEMQKAIDAFNSNNITRLLEANGATIDHLQAAVDEYKEAAGQYMDSLDNADRSNPMMMRMINDQMMGVERVFVIPGGLPERPDTRHAIFAPAKFNAYGASAFPGISDLSFEIEKLTGQAKLDRWEEIKKHLSDLMIIVKSAAAYLKPLDQI